MRQNERNEQGLSIFIFCYIEQNEEQKFILCLEYPHQFEYYETGAVIQAHCAREIFAITVSHNL